LNLLKHLLFGFTLLFSLTNEAQELPPIQNFTPNIYGGENQNWSISQSQEKYIYVANNKGLLEYNGAKWKLYPSPNNTIIRSVNVIDNKIYTGCFREFGYWEKNEFDNLTYHSLIDELKEPLFPDEQFWNIIKYDKWILFQSLHRIYIYNSVRKTFDIIKSKTHLPKIFKVGNSIYFQKIDEGVFRIENGVPVLISDDPLVKKNILVNIFLIDHRVLFQTQEAGFYYLNNNKLEKWQIQANKTISSISVYSSLRLKNGNFVLGTISNGIYELNKKGEIINEINLKKGLNNNTVLSIYEDIQQNLWLGLDNGISVINFNTPFSVYNDVDGKLGSVYASALYKDQLYVGTNQGLFYKDNKSDEFQFIKGTEGQVWCLKIYDDTLFCGHNSGTFIINKNRAELITDKGGTWDILPIKNKDNLLIQGHYSGLSILEKVNNKWQFKNDIKGFDISSRYFGFDSENQLFVNHEYKGVFKLQVNDEFTKILNYAPEKGISKGLKSSLTNFNNELLYSSDKGVFIYNEEKDLFLKDPLLSINLLAHSNYISGKLIADNQQNIIWGFTDKNIVYFESAKLKNELIATKVSLPATSRKFITGYENITHLNEQIYLLGASKGYILLDLSKLQNKEYKITLNAIEHSALESEKHPVNKNKTNEFESDENYLYFSYNVPEFDKFNEVNYQYQLEGLHNNWSDWSSSPEVSFENLPFGEYTFNVKARVGNKLSNNTASYSFKIKRPWLISNQMIMVYLLFFLGLLWLMQILNKRYYTRQKNKTLEKKQRAFALTQANNEKMIVQLKNEKLQNDIDSKSREIAASTMSIIKKNDLINSIKKELVKVENDQHVKSVIKIIDQNLSDENNWEMFKEAFDNADHDFLTQLKSLHPKLTPNDLRLCAYLRLNLSSKEIAPLLNISAKSIETKRYRLRKKMNLPHEKSLVEYILEL